MKFIVDKTSGSTIVKNDAKVILYKELIAGPQGERGDAGFGSQWGDIGGTVSDQIDLQAELDAKSDQTHNHDSSYSSVGHNHDGIYPPVVHVHVESEITDLDKYTKSEVDSKDSLISGSIDAHEADSSNPHGVTFSQLSDAPTSLPPDAHTHVESEVINLDKYSKTEVDSKDSAIQNNLDLHESSSNNPHNVQYAQLPDVPATFAPDAHTHSESDIVGLDKYKKVEVDSLLSNKSDNGHTHPYSPLVHTHAATEISQDTANGLTSDNVQGALDELSGIKGVVEYTAIAIENTGDGTIEGDIGAFDWTGHPYALGTALKIEKNHSPLLGHNVGISYKWVGSKPVTIGVGGAYVPLSSDFQAMGTDDHDILKNRDTPGQHVIGAITGLQTSLDAKEPIFNKLSAFNKNFDANGVSINVSRADHLHDTYTQAEVDSKDTVIQSDLDNHKSNVANPHSVKYAQLPDVPATFTPEAHAHTESEVTDLDKYTKAEVDAKDSAHATATNPHAAVIWKGEWVGGTHEPNDLTRDGDWAMVANKTTTERPAPQEIGNPENSLDPLIAYATNSVIAVVKMEHRIVMQKDGWLKSLYVKAPFYDADSIAKITITNEGTGEVRIISNVIIAQNGAWTLILSASFIAKTGVTLVIGFEFYNSSAANNITGGWTSGIGIGAPPTTEFTIDSATAPTQIIINHTDLDATSRATELDGVAVDSIILASETGDASRNVEMKVTSIDTTAADNTKYLVDLVTVGNSVRDNRTCTINIDVPVTQPTQYYESLNYYPTGDPSFATISSKLYHDGVEQPGTASTAYGIYITFQEAYISPDWDILALSGGGSGGSEYKTLISLLDTPEAITSGDAGKVIAVNATEDAFEFVAQAVSTGVSRKIASFTVSEADGFDHYYWLDTVSTETVTIPEGLTEGHRFTVQLNAAHSFVLSGVLSATVLQGKTLAPVGDRSVISFVVILPSGDLHATGDLA